MRLSTARFPAGNRNRHLSKQALSWYRSDKNKSTKEAALDVARLLRKEVFEKLPMGEFWFPHELGSVYFEGTPSKEENGNCLDRVTPILTSFGKRVGREKMYWFLKSLVKEISDQELFSVEARSLNEWLDLLKNGLSRATFLYDYWLARVIGRDIRFQTPGKLFKVYPSLPPIDPYELRNIRIRNKTANCGRPFEFSWSKGGEGKQNWVYNSSRFLQKKLDSWNTVSSLPRKTRLYLNRYSKRWALIVAARSQGKGRPVVNVGKHINFIRMRVSQALSDAVENYWWNFTGDLQTRCNKLRFFSRQKEGSSMADGDDLVVIGPRGLKISADVGSYDLTIKPVEVLMFYAALRKILSDYWWKMMLHTEYVIRSLPMVVKPYGLMWTSSPWYGIISGDAFTHVFGTVNNIARNLSIRKSWVQSPEAGFQAYEQFANMRPAKQFVCKDLLTCSQLVWRESDPSNIHGIISRIGRNLVTKESYSQEYLNPDVALVSTLIPGFGHEKFDDLLAFVAENWDLRTPDHIIERQCKNWLIMNRRQDAGYRERQAMVYIMSFLR